MSRVIGTLLLVVFFVAFARAAFTLSTNGDTAQIVVQTLVCVMLLIGAVCCKNLRRAGAD